VQIDAAGDEALTKNINHGDAREQPSPVTPKMTPVL